MGGIGYTAEKCDLRLMPGPPPDDETYGSVEQWVFSGRNEQCAAKRLVTSSDCEVWLDFQHGAQSFGCKGRLHGMWGAHAMGFFGAAVTTVGATRKVELPAHSEMRTGWLAPVDTEGLHKSYPISGDDFIDCYPRHFTKVGAKIAWPNPVFGVTTQSLHYTTMRGEERAAVTGEAALDCLKVYFLSWTAPKASEETERHLSSFLQDLRLEPVQFTEAQRAEVCSADAGRR